MFHDYIIYLFTCYHRFINMTMTNCNSVLVNSLSSAFTFEVLSMKISTFIISTVTLISMYNPKSYYII